MYRVFCLYLPYRIKLSSQKIAKILCNATPCHFNAIYYHPPKIQINPNLIDYIEKDIQEKSIEVRFHKEGITLTCTFDKDGNCDESFLFPDDAQLVEDFVSYLTDHHDYSFMRSRFILGNCYLKIKELKEQRSDICLVFFQ